MKFRSPHLLNRQTSALLVVDVQERLTAAIESSDRVIAISKLLIEAATILDVPVLVSEQYTKGLGKTVKDLDVSKAAVIEEKSMFSCRQCEQIMALLEEKAIQTVLLCGIEAHVCVAQTAFDLMASGFNVQVAVDAVGSRNSVDRDTAISRLNMHGVASTTAEAAIFEWCETSSAAEFKQISQLVK